MRKPLFILLSAVTATVVWIGIRSQQAGPSKPSLRLLGMMVDSLGQDAYQFEVSNPTSEDLFFAGGGPESPMMRCQIWTPRGWEEFDTTGGCGTGISKHSLPAGGYLRFGQQRMTNKTVRLGLALATESEWKKKPLSFGWLPRPLAKWARDWQRNRSQQLAEKNMMWSERLDCIPQTISEMMAMEFVMEGGAHMDEANRRTEMPWRYGLSLKGASTSPASSPTTPGGP